jgi:hypothetical protein
VLGLEDRRLPLARQVFEAVGVEQRLVGTRDAAGRSSRPAAGSRRPSRRGGLAANTQARARRQTAQFAGFQTLSPLTGHRELVRVSSRVSERKRRNARETICADSGCRRGAGCDCSGRSGSGGPPATSARMCGGHRYSGCNHGVGSGVGKQNGDLRTALRPIGRGSESGDQRGEGDRVTWSPHRIVKGSPRRPPGG